MLTTPQAGITPWADQNGALTTEGAKVMDQLIRFSRDPIYPNGEGVILTSPDGTQYRLTVDNAGVLSTVAV